MSATSGASVEGDIDGSAEKNFDHDSVSDISQTCRVCACVNNYFIPIYDGEGVEHDLGSKVNQYLPISVSETDDLPTQLCYQCASVLITWHEMFVGALKAEEDLRKLKSKLDGEKQIIEEGGGKEIEEPVDCPVLVLDQVLEEEDSKPLIVSAQPISMKTEKSDVDSGNDDSQDFQSLVDINSEDPLGPDVDIKFTMIEPLKLPDYSKFVVCKLCGECINTSQMEMADHEKIAHGIKIKKSQENLSCVCEYCGKVFSTVRKVAYHRRYTHMLPARGAPTMSEKICEVCGAVLKSSKKLREHRRNNHIEARNYECVVCSMRFKLKETLVNHQKCAHNVFIGEKYQPAFHRRSYTCFMCDAELASKFSLRRHLLIKHQHNTEEKWSFKETTYDCDHCDRKFKNKISYLRHRDKVLDGKLEKRFYCDLCPKGFFCHTDFIRHRRTHKIASNS